MWVRMFLHVCNVFTAKIMAMYKILNALKLSVNMNVPRKTIMVSTCKQIVRVLSLGMHYGSWRD